MVMDCQIMKWQASLRGAMVVGSHLRVLPCANISSSSAAEGADSSMQEISIRILIYIYINTNNELEWCITILQISTALHWWICPGISNMPF